MVVEGEAAFSRTVFGGTLLIRADASSEIGAGHAMRCLALGQVWRDGGGRVVFVMANSTEWVQKRLEKEGFQVFLIHTQHDLPADILCTLQAARDLKTAWIVIDGYQFTTEYVNTIKSAGFGLVLIDDLGIAADCTADFILNANFGAERSMYRKCAPYAQLLLGTQYTLLRQDFTLWRRWQREIPERARHLLVTMGGSDPDNITQLALDAVESLEPPIATTVITGGSNPRSPDLIQRASRLGGHIRIEESVADVPELMARSDLAVIAGGGTLWELLFMSCPVVSFGRTDVQRKILEPLHEQGAIVHMGDPKQADPAILGRIIRELSGAPFRRAKMASAAKRYIDGQGAHRVCGFLANSKPFRA